MRVNSPNRSLSLAAAQQWTRTVMNKSSTLELAARPTRGFSGYFVFWLVVGECFCLQVLRLITAFFCCGTHGAYCRVELACPNTSQTARLCGRKEGSSSGAFHLLWKTCTFWCVVVNKIGDVTVYLYFCHFMACFACQSFFLLCKLKN